MAFVPRPEYHSPSSRQRRNLAPQAGRAGLTLLEAAGDGELPDATLTETDRMGLKEEVCLAESRLSSHQMMFLACAFEAGAWRKRAQESRR